MLEDDTTGVGIAPTSMLLLIALKLLPPLGIGVTCVSVACVSVACGLDVGCEGTGDGDTTELELA